MIPAVRNLSYEVRLKKLGLWSLEDRRVRAGLQNCIWLIFSQVRYFFRSFILYSWIRGHSLKLNKNRVRTDLDNISSANVLLIPGTNLITTQSVHHR